ncbi:MULTISPECIES: TPM domain-containing protein [Brucella/Ochrobactrum group]|uniref:TPM domain-containing protein n=1 Tax=Ochrobactrum soli TaxID=2448455 RepID=A0A2P9HQM3_9HYPH|nr:MULTISPECIES: TPM domain-containing protein [Brucella]MCI0999866.1 TPM domain-containing protein [Ochrobactrum sp. C6C9]RRD24316.1 TPM domain-containing protein [Brucellaceae bacterium VT-16-1752]WHT41721.1 TPM domain-containing protein [Ochrobactrum sp. SSR]MDX4073867.1 TPM domain-containing protein [Brucella sp. NBRC 113783]WHS31802.1 TPM domain-containing protein [Brucella sp. NM4]
MKHHTLIGAEDHARIADAIRDAEAGTSGEIYAVLARSSDDYFFAAGFVATCGILLASVIAACLAHWYWFDISLPMFGLSILAAFISAMLVLWLLPSIRMLLVPRRIRYKRAHLNALQQFLARNVHITENRTGILLFVSMAEHYAEVIADAGIHARVEQDEWNAIVATLIHHASRSQMAEGFVTAIDQAGTLLEKHFPAGADNMNELDDHLIEL